jgi:putative phosphoesterase
VAARHGEIGLISDTHGLVRPEALDALAGVSQIVHAGDVGSQEVLDALARVAPVVAVRGNNDRGVLAGRLPERAVLERPGLRLLVVHDRHELTEDPAEGGFDVVVSGHSHRPRVERVAGVLHVNPGSAGPRRFHLPVAIARLWVERGDAVARILELSLDS